MNLFYFVALIRAKSRIFLPFAIVALMCVSLILGGCSSNEPDGSEQPGVKAPQITSVDIPGDTIIELGQTIKLAPEVGNYNSSDPFVFEWKVGDAVFTTDSILSFKPTETGSYKLAYKVSNSIGNQTLECNVRVKLYHGGFYILNEGQMGTTFGSLSYLYHKSGDRVTGIIEKANDGSSLGYNPQFATVWDGKLYVLAKELPYVTSLNEDDLKLERSVASAPGGVNNFQAHAMAGIDSNTAVITSSKGIYRIDLASLTLSAQPLAISITGEVANPQSMYGDVVVSGNYIFALNRDYGLLAFNKSDLSFKSVIDADAVTGVVVTPSGTVWAGTSSAILKINPSTLGVTKQSLPVGFEFYSTYGSWHKSAFVASTIEETIYFSRATGEWDSGMDVYCYKDGDASSLSMPLFRGKSTDMFYGSGISVDSRTGDIAITYVESGWGAHYLANTVVVVDSKGNVLSSNTYNDGIYWFPAMTF